MSSIIYSVKSGFCTFINLLSLQRRANFFLFLCWHSLLEQQIVQLDLSFSWAFGVKWSPSGNTLAYVGNNSMIYFVDDVGPSPLVQNVAFCNLPLRDMGQHPLLLTVFAPLYFGPE
ncbi:actin-related protein 2/3 complex subunit 1A-like [Durio zibethinus]|uniref:Actin-related protein 2/3 complex subunit 1A-like n=1 Tax=Durio zibethinus TaxID=66656 RepID=A0A6P5YJF4_DURZI|nr:actin-related protein 2/3 complex subunit 1A-like [Durio zibethinus]